ncbi:hypothetical protein EX30DRAFT_396736 [Ascodesmis nigricans]|uniref:Uncharacterized protein n=1 Tax=Ascodesmis nigricans TaxID=341454 RepID=A0A4S2MTR3_9PEZI|nr:hypothetical protein EX30DRAFT_396736 [Ascodesmis nigricans]
MGERERSEVNMQKESEAMPVGLGIQYTATSGEDESSNTDYEHPGDKDARSDVVIIGDDPKETFSNSTIEHYTETRPPFFCNPSYLDSSPTSTSSSSSEFYTDNDQAEFLTEGDISQLLDTFETISLQTPSTTSSVSVSPPISLPPSRPLTPTSPGTYNLVTKLHTFQSQITSLKSANTEFAKAHAELSIERGEWMRRAQELERENGEIMGAVEELREMVQIQRGVVEALMKEMEEGGVVGEGGGKKGVLVVPKGMGEVVRKAVGEGVLVEEEGEQDGGAGGEDGKEVGMDGGRKLGQREILGEIL